MVRITSSMYKPTVRQAKNLGRMTESEMRQEYARQAKTANKRIKAIQKAGLYSPAIKEIGKLGITRFGVQNQGLKTPKEIQRAYRDLMNFLNSTTSTKTGIKTTVDKMVQNFNMKFNGDYVAFSKKSKKIFDLYEDLAELSRKGELQTSDKYDIVSDLDTLYNAGEIDENTTAEELIQYLNSRVAERDAMNNARQNQLHFNWKV